MWEVDGDACLGITADLNPMVSKTSSDGHFGTSGDGLSCSRLANHVLVALDDQIEHYVS
jgi:hypothetical protein